MFNKKKWVILTITMMLAVIVSTALVSFSLAGDGLADRNESATKVSNDTITGLSAANLADSLTNIDHIIDKASNTALSASERIFHIVQIVSNGKTDTTFKKYVEDGYFRTHVINANRSDGHAEMPDTFTDADGAVQKTVQIDVMTVADLKNLVATSNDYSRVSIADLVYVSNDPTDPYVVDYNAEISNDIPEDIYNLLHTYSDDKPIIIDYSSGSTDSSNPYSMENLATNVLAYNYIKYNTFKWKTGVSLENFLNRSESVFIPLHIKEQDHDSKILFVSGDTGVSTMFDAVYASLMNDNVFKDNAYYRKGYVPKYFTPSKIKYTDIADASFADGYDFVFIEADTYGSMTESIYNAIASVSYAKKHVIYSDSLINAGSSDVETTTNYGTLLGLLVSPEGMAYNSNVYVSNYTFFDSMVSDPVGTQEAADEIAELLKSSTYREFGKNSASGKKYTVLEIQPAYPIDVELATKNKKYYTNPSNVFKKSKEASPDGAEYYAFEMTMEKIIALTGLSADQIELVQVSTEELQGMKTSFADKYDLIYIGGNTSAVTPLNEYSVNGGMNLGMFVDNGYAYYGMYSHTGAVVQYANNNLNGYKYGTHVVSGGNDITKTNLAGLLAYVDAGMPIIISDDVTDAYTALASTSANVYKNNQIDPDSNMFKFLSYALEGYEAVADADGNIPAQKYVVNKKTNVLAGFDKDDVIRVPNMDGHYGNTLTTYAVIFDDGVTVPEQVKDTDGKWVDYNEAESPTKDNVADTPAAKIKALVAGSGARPTMNLNDYPLEYVVNTPSSYLETPKLSFDFELLTNGNTDIQSFTVTLYIDDNANGLFTDKGEAVKSIDVTVEGGKAVGSFSYEMDADFYGPISWKIEAVANIKSGTTLVAGAAISYSGVSKVARTTQEKELVHILQVMPKGSTQQDMTTLYFCPDCQLSNTNAEYNIHLNSSVSSTDKITFMSSLYQNYTAQADLVKTLELNPEEGHYGIGLHRHTFGIWSYDKLLGYDDWNSNLAQDLMNDEGDYEFEIEIFNPETLDAMNAKYTDNDVAALQEKVEKHQSNVNNLQKEYNELLASGADEDTLKEKEAALETAKAALTKAKKDESSLTSDKLQEAAETFESYENLLATEKQMETDLRNVLTYIRDHKDDIERISGKTFADLGVKEHDVFAEVLNTGKYNEIFSDNRTSWRSNDGTASIWSLGRRQTVDAMITFTAEDYEGEDKLYQFGVAGDLIAAYKKNADGSETKMTKEEYVAAGGSLIELDHENYRYEFSTEIVADYSFTGYYYQRWADAHSLAVLELEKYWDQVRDAYGKDWMKEVYSIVIVGAAENFNEQDLTEDVCETLADYEDSDGNMLMFHDTMTKYDNQHAVNITKHLAEPFGLERFHMTSEDNTLTVKAGYDPSKYFMTVLDYNDTSKMVYSSFNGKDWGNFSPKRTFIGVSTAFATYNKTYVSGEGAKLPYRYAEFAYEVAVTWMRDFKTYQTNMATGNFGTNRATQLNSGIITSYPFNIGKQLNISGTHNQYLALDVEDDEVITWYTLSGGYTKTETAQAKNHEGSSIYAASPGDAQDSYFIYTKGNVSYCGAGHAKVTGPLTENNDERMLFINIICNSARKNALKPSIKIYDPDKKKVVPSAGNKYIRMNSDGEPYIEVSSEGESIRFGFMATVDTTASENIEQTRIFFRYKNADDKFVDEVVASYPSTAGNPSLTSGVEYYMNTNDTTKNKIGDSIKLKPEYFNGYEDCAYVYIEVTDSNGEVLLEKIRIDLVRDLFDMT